MMIAIFGLVRGSRYRSAVTETTNSWKVIREKQFTKNDLRKAIHEKQFTKNDSRKTIREKRFAKNDSRKTIHEKRFTKNDSRKMIHGKRFTWMKAIRYVCPCLWPSFSAGNYWDMRYEWFTKHVRRFPQKVISMKSDKSGFETIAAISNYSIFELFYISLGKWHVSNQEECFLEIPS